MNEIEILEVKYPSMKQLSIWLMKLDTDQKELKKITTIYNETVLNFIGNYEEFVDGDGDDCASNSSVPFVVSTLEQFYGYNAGLKALGNAILTVTKNNLYFDADGLVNPTTNKKYSQNDKKEYAEKEVAGLEGLVGLLHELTFTIKEKLNTFKSTRATKY